jgi:inhibitor of the pro-sigma K processing machinery
MKMVMWGILFVSSLGLLYQLFTNRSKIGRALSRFTLHIVLGAIGLIVLNLFADYTSFTLPVNLVTLGVIGLLGLPGFALLGALKVVLV